MKKKIMVVLLGTALTTTAFYSSTSASADEINLKGTKVVNERSEGVNPEAIGKWALAGGKFVAKQLTSAWAADQWSTANTKKIYEIDENELEILFDR